MSSLMVYLILILDNVQKLFIAFGIVSVITFVIMLIIICENSDYEDDLKRTLKWIKKPIIICFIVSILSFVISAFLPNTKQMATIIIVPKITNAISQNEELKKLPDNVLKLANEWIVKLSPEQTIEQSKKVEEQL